MSGYIQTVNRKLVSGGVRTHYYLRVPQHLQHIMGARIRLPDDQSAARERAAAILAGDIQFIDDAAFRLRGFAKRSHDNALARANKRGLPYELSVDSIVDMLEAQRFLCAVSGLPFSLIWSRGKNPFAPSLDRMDNALGYTAANTRLVLSAVNFGMNVWGVEIYASICAAVAQKQNTVLNFDVNRFHRSVNGVRETDGEPAK